MFPCLVLVFILPNFFLVSPSVQNDTTTYTYLSDHSVEESFYSKIPPTKIKWSISINSSFPQGLNVSYVLSLPNGSPLPPAPFFPNRTSNQITTYYLHLEGEFYALLNILQLATVDGVSLPIGHSLQASTLVLQFPPFSSSLFYDPSIELGVLLQDVGEPSSNDEPLIIGVVVGGSVAFFILVLLAVVTIIKHKGKRDLTMINFGGELDKNRL